MADNSEGFLARLIREIKSLFGSKQRSPTQAPAGTPTSQNEFVASPGSWTAPIHGSWHNLGGFDPSMVRFDDPKGATKGRGHMGVDMGAAAGTPVYAMGAGTVTSVGTDTKGGNIVGVTHPGGEWSYYAHLSTAKVQKGDKVDSNTAVGTVGNTGNPGNPKDPLKTQEGGRTWPHLHFGVKEKGSWVDPAKYFSIPRYDAEYAKNPGKYQNFWLNDKAKEEAQAFNMRDHVTKQRVAFSRDVDTLLKVSFEYASLAKKLNGRSS
jgi:murein DD-endopeptidase MepM/ murein hydrolase activator NlpD